MSDELLGDDFNLFWDPTVSFDSPDWERQVSMGDIGFDTDPVHAEIPKRIRSKVYKKGRDNWTLTFTSNYSRNAAFHKAVIAAIVNGTKIHLAIVDGDDADDPEANVWHAMWLLKGPIGASLDEAASIEVEGVPHHDTGTSDEEQPEYIPGET